MSDYRNPHEPIYGYEPADSARFLGLAAGIACLVIILGLGLALGVGHEPPTRVASHNVTSSQTTAPPTTATKPTTAPTQAPVPNRP
jgi:hypothetical protein